VRRRWLEWRAAPLRGEVLQELIGLFAASLAAARDDWRGLVDRLAAVLATSHLADVAGRRVKPWLVVLLVGLGRMTAEEAVRCLDLPTMGGGEALAMLWQELPAEALRAVLMGLAWDGYYPSVPGDALMAMVERAVADGWGEPVIACVMRMSEPRRSRMLAEVLPGLRGELAERARSVVAAQIEATEDVFARVELLRRLSPGIDLRGRIEPVCADEWTRLAAIEDAVARCAAWERRMAELGPLATLAESRRWLSVVRSTVATHPDEVYRYQTWVPRALWGEALEGLAPALACEGMVWLVWGDETADARPALHAVLGCGELANGKRIELLRLLLTRLPGDSAEVAARALMAAPECSVEDTMLAARYLPTAERAALVDRWIHDGPFVSGRPELARAAVLPALARLAEAAGSAGRAELVALARELADGRAEALLDFAEWMTADERAALAASGLAGERATREVGRFIGLLPEADRLAALAGPIARAIEISDGHECWSALSELVTSLPDDGAEVLRGLVARREGRGPHEIAAFPRWAMGLQQRRLLVAHEVQYPYRPYTAWLLGMDARGLPAEERGPVLDRAIEEFAAIAGAPTSPGNDEGPFVEMSDLLSERQVRRALEVIETMSAAPWGGDLEVARQFLGIRLVELGCVDEGLARIRETTDGRAWALGAVAGKLLAKGTGWAEAARWMEAEEDVGSCVTGVVWAMPAAARAGRGDVADGLLRRLGRISDAEARDDALRVLLESFGAALPVERWLAEIRGCADGLVRVGALLELATVAGAEATAVVSEAVAVLVAEGLDIDEVADELFAVAGCLPLATRVELLKMWIGGAPRRGASLLRSWGEDPAGREIAAVLRAMGGDEALVTAARELAAVARLLD